MSSGARYRVLVVDDEPIVLQLVTRILERQGHRVDPAGDGAEALACLRGLREPPQAVVLDLSLRPAGARATTEALRDAGASCGWVWIGGEAPTPEDQTYLEALGGRFVAKPFAPRALLEAVSAVVPVASVAPGSGAA